jgi:hypothetical protein
MSKLTKFILIILTIVSFAIGLTYLFAIFMENYNAIQSACFSFIGFVLSSIINDEILMHENTVESFDE